MTLSERALFTEKEMMYWVIFFFIFAALSRFLFKLPPILWKILFVIPYFGILGESLKPFVEQSWPFPRDGLSDFFACLISGVGACVTLYASAYFDLKDAKKFFPLLFAFTGSMLGVVWADNVFLFYMFWEATGICSFLLVGFNYKDPEARQGAKQALMVTMAGGLLLLAALLILVHETGSHSLLDILYGKSSNREYNGILFFALAIAALTKSAQFPFHFWLPGAMAAPVPASAYLHSATMVKLGVFLLARFSPLFEGHMEWTMTLCVFGGITLLWGLVVSLTKSDVKELLAWTTVSSLGGMFILIGLNMSYSWKAFFSYVFAHSCYKACLFLCAGNIQKQMGTRDLNVLSGLFKQMPMTSISILLAVGSMIGFPFSIGFLAKEYLLKSALAQGGNATLLVAVLMCSSALNIVIAYRLILTMFNHKREDLARNEARISMWLPCLALASVGWWSSLFLDPINTYFLSPVVSSIVLQKVDVTLEMWTGMNLTVMLSIFSIALGVCFSVLAFRHLHKLNLRQQWEKIYPAHLNMFMRFSAWITSIFQSGRLSFYVMWTLSPLLLMVLYFFDPEMSHFSFVQDQSYLFQMIPALLIFFGVLALIFSHYALNQVMGLGVVGFGVSLLYLHYGANDVSMTQVAVESLSIFIFVFCLRFLKTNSRSLSTSYQVARFFVSALSFLAVVVVCNTLSSGKVPSRIAPYFIENAQPLARGMNIVNVILVDFRALDTMGEITVLGILAIGVHFALVRRRRIELVLKDSSLLSVATRYHVPILALFSLYILMRGHNAPGGGFIAGLILAISVGFYCITFGEKAANKILLIPPQMWVVMGLGTALVSGLLPMLKAENPFVALWFEGRLSWLGSPLLFDVGVYLLVLGMGTALIFSLRRRGQ